MWNHNTHFHNYLLCQIPTRIDRALDIGCGEGLFASKLARRAKLVDAIDVDFAILQEALSQRNLSNICYQHADFLEADLPHNSYDAIACIASLHHMDLEAALSKMKVLLKPSGKLIILGLYRETTIVDFFNSFISIILNQIYSIWHSRSMTMPTSLAPTRSPHLSIAQIERVTKLLIPGYRLRRHLFWRYSSIWEKP